MGLAWENLQEVFVMLVVAVAIHCFSTSSLILPWAIARFLHQFYTFSPAYRKVIRDTLILTFLDLFVTVLPRVLRFWPGVFYPQAFFYPCRSFRTFLTQPAFIKASVGASSSSLKFPGLHAGPRNTDPVYQFVWVTTIHKRGIVVGSIYGLLLAGSVKHPLLTRFELFSRQAGCVANRMAYLSGHRAIQSVLNEGSSVCCNLCFESF